MPGTYIAQANILSVTCFKTDLSLLKTPTATTFVLSVFFIYC